MLLQCELRISREGRTITFFAFSSSPLFHAFRYLFCVHACVCVCLVGYLHDTAHIQSQQSSTTQNQETELRLWPSLIYTSILLPNDPYLYLYPIGFLFFYEEVLSGIQLQPATNDFYFPFLNVSECHPGPNDYCLFFFLDVKFVLMVLSFQQLKNVGPYPYRPVASNEKSF